MSAAASLPTLIAALIGVAAGLTGLTFWYWRSTDPRNQQSLVDQVAIVPAPDFGSDMADRAVDLDLTGSTLLDSVTATVEVDTVGWLIDNPPSLVVPPSLLVGDDLRSIWPAGSGVNLDSETALGEEENAPVATSDVMFDLAEVPPSTETSLSFVEAGKSIDLAAESWEEGKEDRETPIPVDGAIDLESPHHCHDGPSLVFLADDPTVADKEVELVEAADPIVHESPDAAETVDLIDHPEPELVETAGFEVGASDTPSMNEVPGADQVDLVSREPAITDSEFFEGFSLQEWSAVIGSVVANLGDDDQGTEVERSVDIGSRT